MLKTFNLYLNILHLNLNLFLISLNTVQYKKKSFPLYPSLISKFDSNILNFPSLSCQHMNEILGELKDSEVISITKHHGQSKTQIFDFKFESFQMLITG